jgi:hypothetical protein
MTRADIEPVAATRFLQIAFEAEDWLAVLLKNHETGRVVQRVAPLPTVATPRFQDWLIRENRAGASVYVSVNPLRARTTIRQRHAIGLVRHVFLDADAYLSAVLAAIAERGDLPKPSYVVRTSEDRGHVFWRVRAFSTHEVEALEKHLARELHTDPAATACSQLTRVPGSLNHKHSPPYRVVVDYVATSAQYTPDDFPQPVTPYDVRGTGTYLEPHLNASAGVIDRARRYMAAVPPAVSGQHGDVHTFRICCRLVRGFALSDSDAMTVLADWNARCQPPWTEGELTDKLRRARRYGREPMGMLLGDRV